MNLRMHIVAVMALLVLAASASAQKIGDFRSIGSGTWSNKANTSIWEELQSTGSDWRIKSADSLGADSIKMRIPGYNAASWLKAIVPGTIYSSYLADSLQTGEKEPTYGANVDNINVAKYNGNFWYRTEFTVPTDYIGKRIWLNVNSANKISEIYVNNVRVGTLKGFRMRGKFEVTSLVNKTGTNVIAILIHSMTNQLNNLEEPTYHPAAGWDWMPPAPAYDRGLTDKISLSASGPVTIADPWMRTVSLTNNNTGANMAFSGTFINHSDSLQIGTLTFSIVGLGSVDVKIPLQPHQNFYASNYPFPLNNIKLWWPNGSGDPNLYTCKLVYKINGVVSDSTSFNFGIRKYDYKNDKNGVLNLYVNGKRVFVRGGNWGLSEYLLRSHGADYDTRIRFHKEMNFNMIRNWTGSVTDDEFYDYCDKYGIMLWDDFWLVGFTILNDEKAFMDNVPEKIKRIRNHASLAVWCGDNEGIAFQDNKMMDSVKKYDGGDRLYQSNSREKNNSDNSQFGLIGQGGMSGDGPYYNQDLPAYFQVQPVVSSTTVGTYGYHNEVGVACFPTAESFRQFMPPDKLWPRNSVWDFDHYFGYSSSSDQRGTGADPSGYVNKLNSKYGTATGIEDFCRKAQLLNIETHKALYEGYVAHMWNDASGVMMWMSQPAFPTMIWQTYDYYFDCTGGYWGVKKACEPVHILWNISTNDVNVSNSTNSDVTGLTASAQYYDINGNAIAGTNKSVAINATKDTVLKAFNTLDLNNLALNKPVVASNSDSSNPAKNVDDGNQSTRWASGTFNDSDYIYIDLGPAQSIGGVRLIWQNGAKSFKIQVSNDASNWTDVYSTTAGAGGTNDIVFPQTTARYVRMLGSQRINVFGYSLYEFAVYPKLIALPQVYFVKLQLKDSAGKIVSDNFYWNSPNNDMSTLSNMPIIPITGSGGVTTLPNGHGLITANLTNPANSAGIAFAVHIQLINPDGSRVLPVFMNDNYFSILKGETKTVTMEVDPALLTKGTPHLLIEQYNSRK